MHIAFYFLAIKAIVFIEIQTSFGSELMATVRPLKQ